MGRGEKCDRILLLAFLVAILAFAKAANETDAGFDAEQDGVLEFAKSRKQSNVMVYQPGEKVPVPNDLMIWGLIWVGSGNGFIPAGAVVGGYEGGDTLYVGRAYLDGLLIAGKVHPRHKVIYIPYAGKEYKFSNYELLVEVRREIGHIPEENSVH